jgi:hypothetical protein
MVGIRLDERAVGFAFRLGVFLAVPFWPTCMIDVAAISSADGYRTWAVSE